MYVICHSKLSNTVTWSYEGKKVKDKEVLICIYIFFITFFLYFLFPISQNHNKLIIHPGSTDAGKQIQANQGVSGEAIPRHTISVSVQQTLLCKKMLYKMLQSHFCHRRTQYSKSFPWALMRNSLTCGTKHKGVWLKNYTCKQLLTVYNILTANQTFSTNLFFHKMEHPFLAWFVLDTLLYMIKSLTMFWYKRASA